MFDLYYALACDKLIGGTHVEGLWAATAMA